MKNNEVKNKKTNKKIKRILQFLLNPKLLICLLIAWMITNGWSYVFLFLGTYFKIGWMLKISGAYLAFLWLPFTPEKIVTIAIAITLLRFLFPEDKKTLAVLRRLHLKAKKGKENGTIFNRFSKKQKTNSDNESRT